MKEVINGTFSIYIIDTSNTLVAQIFVTSSYKRYHDIENGKI